MTGCDSILAGIIGKQVKNLCGTAAVRAEFWFVNVTVGYIWEGKTKAMTPEPEDLPSVLYCRKGRNHKTDGRNVFMMNQRVDTPWLILAFLKK